MGEDFLADNILSGNVPEGGSVTVDYADGKAKLVTEKEPETAEK